MTMKYVAATNNAHKLIELRSILEPLGVELLSLSDVGFTDEIDETGTTFTENALIKARTVRNATGLTAIADDSGLCVDALGGEPGVYSARYGGDSCRSDSERTTLLLKNMEGRSNRAARFVSAIAVVYPDGREITTEGTVEGIITCAPLGDGGFGYDPVFEVDDGLTMAQISPERKNQISHRARALEKVSKMIGTSV